MANHLAGFAPFVPHFMKVMVQQGLEGSSVAALAMEKFAQSALLQTDDKQEGIDAFLNKRVPNFKGQ
jgi:enoyl-CoA hydratase/carnithine racemase